MATAVSAVRKVQNVGLVALGATVGYYYFVPDLLKVSETPVPADSLLSAEAPSGRPHLASKVYKDCYQVLCEPASLVKSAQTWCPFTDRLKKTLLALCSSVSSQL